MLAKRIHFFILPLLFPFLIGASLIDKETKATIQTLDQKLDDLAKQIRRQSQNESKLLEEQQRRKTDEQSFQRELSQRLEGLAQKMEALEKKPLPQISIPPPTPTPPPMVAFPDMSDQFLSIENRLRGLWVLVVGTVTTALILFGLEIRGQRRLRQWFRDWELRDLQNHVAPKPTRPKRTRTKPPPNIAVTKVGGKLRQLISDAS